MNFKLICAGDLMTPQVHTIGPDETLRGAAELINRVRVHCLVVSPDGAGRSPGIITIKDIVKVIGDADESALDELRVDDVMTAPSITLPIHLCILDCINLMRMAGVRSVPVMDGPNMVGILSFTDVIRAVTEGEA